jgi:replicative DNA helicase
VADIATQITGHAQKLNGVLLLVSQCTRDKQRMNECPSKHDMKESGDLENMLDCVIGLWREYEDDHAPTWARLVKTKDGGLGGSWCLQRDNAGRLEEVEASHRMPAPDARGEWGHREASGTRRRGR